MSENRIIGYNDTKNILHQLYIFSLFFNHDDSYHSMIVVVSSTQKLSNEMSKLLHTVCRVRDWYYCMSSSASFIQSRMNAYISSNDNSLIPCMRWRADWRQCTLCGQAEHVLQLSILQMCSAITITRQVLAFHWCNCHRQHYLAPKN